MRTCVLSLDWGDCMPIVDTVEELLSIATALGACKVSGWSQPEEKLVQALPAVSVDVVLAVRNAIAEGKTVEETSVQRALEDYGLTLLQIAGGAIETLRQAPKPGQFCREVLLGERKADLVVGLWDHRIMAIECKVSNSATNSVKRLNNDAAVKAEVWLSDFGTRNVVPVAVLSGVFKPHNLLNAQNRGLTLYWAHRLSDMTEWMDLIRRDAPQE